MIKISHSFLKNILRSKMKRAFTGLSSSIMLLLIAMSVPLHSVADIYKVIDENGRVKFTQIPPHKDAKKEEVKNSSGEGNATESLVEDDRQQKQLS